MVEPPQVDPVLPDQDAPPPQPQTPQDDGGVRMLATLEDTREEIRAAIVSAARAMATATGPQEVAEYGKGLQAACQGLVGLSPVLNPKVFEGMFVPKPEVPP